MMLPSADCFWAKVQRRTDGCWLWTGALNNKGYGLIAFRTARRHSLRAHRVAWMLERGEIPEGMQVCHRCDVRNCVNPDHLFVGTVADNNGDMMEKDRHRAGRHIGAANPHAKLTAAQVLTIRAEAESGTARRLLVERFGVSKAQIARIVARRNWADASSAAQQGAASPQAVEDAAARVAPPGDLALPPSATAGENPARPVSVGPVVELADTPPRGGGAARPLQVRILPGPPIPSRKAKPGTPCGGPSCRDSVSTWIHDPRTCPLYRGNAFKGAARGCPEEKR
jgi:hypothetical protein